MKLDKNLIELLDDKDYNDRVNVYYADELVGIVLADAVDGRIIYKAYRKNSEITKRDWEWSSRDILQKNFVTAINSILRDLPNYLI